jgi:hypothetical protein
MSIKEKYTIKSIDNFQCKDWLIHKHYAKRIPPISYAFGLFDSVNILQGVITYGIPVGNSLRDLWLNKYKVLELNMLVINEGLEKNVLSFFVSNSFELLPKPHVIVSYADTSKNHHGYIYQATNWAYTGLSAEFKDYMVKGMEHLHGASVFDLSRGQENRVEWLREKFGDKLYMAERPRKHRYFYFIGKKNEVKDMRKMLPYKIEAYPKGDNIRYDASYKPNTQTQLF